MQTSWSIFLHMIKYLWKAKALVENMAKKNRGRFPIADFFDHHGLQSLNGYKFSFFILQPKKLIFWGVWCIVGKTTTIFFAMFFSSEGSIKYHTNFYLKLEHECKFHLKLTKTLSNGKSQDPTPQYWWGGFHIFNFQVNYTFY